MTSIEPKSKLVTIEGGDVMFVKCECCGLTEECTVTYIAEVKSSNHGRWICGLCTVAVKDEMEKYCTESVEEALERHMRFCKNFKMNSPPKNSTEDLIGAVKQLMIRSLDSPRSPRSNLSSSSVQSDSCDFSLND
ncbi:uncharacterized protein [Rutidosis leptorrhynchoides]|uniref:uncharacterized protein n=1 Tax=Rutidosis leptorrhynchoides TaxID=125765 RepID=UPI003A990957